MDFILLNMPENNFTRGRTYNIMRKEEWAIPEAPETLDGKYH